MLVAHWYNQLIRHRRSNKNIGKRIRCRKLKKERLKYKHANYLIVASTDEPPQITPMQSHCSVVSKSNKLKRGLVGRGICDSVGKSSEMKQKAGFTYATEEIQELGKIVNQQQIQTDELNLT